MLQDAVAVLDAQRGAIVLMHRPQTDFLRNDRPQPSEGDGPVQTGRPDAAEHSARQSIELLFNNPAKAQGGRSRAPFRSRGNYAACEASAAETRFSQGVTAASRRWFGSHKWPGAIVSLMHLAYCITRDDIVLPGGCGRARQGNITRHRNRGNRHRCS